MAGIMRVGTILAASLAVLLVLTSCGTSATASGKPAETSMVEMAKSYRFDPSVIQVSVGTTVTWHNGDNFSHDVRLLDGSNWKSEVIPPGGSASYTFTKAGEHPFDCSLHPHDMKGKVIVVSP